ncbi:MAG: hypothetical protein ACPL0C_05635 [Candidatus Bathyarchaeales archaeon]
MKSDWGEDFLRFFSGKPCIIDTPVGSVCGVWQGADSSFHNGIGNIILTTSEKRWLLVRGWIAVKVLECDVFAKVTYLMMVKVLLSCLDVEGFERAD